MADGSYGGGGSRTGQFFLGQRLRLAIQTDTPTVLLPESTHYDLIIKSDGVYFVNSDGTAVKLNDSATASAGNFTTLAASGAATLASTLAVTGVTTPTGGIAAAGGFTVVPSNFHTGGVTPMVATPGTDTTPVVTETYIAAVFVPANCTLTGIAIMNGSAVAGNMAVALANSSGVVVASSASTAVSGTEAYQRVAFSTPYAAKGPATYYVLLQNNNTSNRFRSHTVGNFGASKKTGETYGTFTTVTAPTAFTASQGPIASLY